MVITAGIFPGKGEIVGVGFECRHVVEFDGFAVGPTRRAETETIHVPPAISDNRDIKRGIAQRAIVGIHDAALGLGEVMGMGGRCKRCLRRQPQAREQQQTQQREENAPLGKKQVCFSGHRELLLLIIVCQEMCGPCMKLHVRFIQAPGEAYCLT